MAASMSVLRNMLASKMVCRALFCSVVANVLWLVWAVVQASRVVIQSQFENQLILVGLLTVVCDLFVNFLV